MTKSILNKVLLITSFLILAFGQESWVPYLGVCASAFGIALFLLFLDGVKRKKIWSFIGFFFISAVHLSWMTAIRYQGYYILFVYILLLVFLALEFTLFTSFLYKRRLNFLSILSLSSLWVLIEWSRLLIFSGYSWNPIGLFLSQPFSRQLAVIGGVYFLSFWVIFSNLLVYQYVLKNFLRKKACFAVGICLFPYLFGGLHQYYRSKKAEPKKKYTVALVQTDLLPEQKDPFFDNRKVFFSPFYQWERIFWFLKDTKKDRFDLIVLPESALPFQAFSYAYSKFAGLQIWENVFGKKALGFCDFSKPFCKNEMVSNGFFAKALSDYFKSELIIGLDHKESKKNYNSAFFFQPKKREWSLYHKQILVPLAEYFPFSWCKNLAARYGIADCFTPGKESGIFNGKIPISASICIEETFGHRMRLGRKNGAEIFVNLTNDAWF